MNIGLDVGYSAVKAIAGDRRTSFPSVVGTPDQARFSVNGMAESIILREPDHVLVGDGAIRQSRHLKRREDRHWIAGLEWYHLVLSALTELTASSVGAIIVTGLPVAFYNDKDTVRDRLIGSHRVQRDGRNRQMFNVGDVRVIPQPFGVLLSQALNDSGRIVDTALATGRVGVIDIGGKTTNILSVDNLEEIGRETSSVSVGAWDVARAIKAHLTDECPDLDLRDHQVVKVIQERQVKYYGEPVSLGTVVDEAVAPLAEQVIAEATQLWNGAASIDAVLITGGGALLMGDQIKAHFRHARVVSEPVWANALGFWRFAQRIAKNESG
jgi:plasmid segregation protein ParM